LLTHGVKTSEKTIRRYMKHLNLKAYQPKSLKRKKESNKHS